MKKLLVGLIVAVVFGCSKDDPKKIKINTKNIEILAGTSQQIDFSTDYDVTFLSSDGFHADVDDEGLVTGIKVGEAEIVIECEGEAHRIPVETRGQYNLYTEPLHDWSLTKSDIIDEYGTPDTENEDGIGYENKLGAEGLIYLFNTDNSIKNVAVLINGNLGEGLADFIDERYHYITNTDDALVFIDSFDSGKAENIIYISVYQGYYVVMYVENDALKSEVKSGINKVHKYIDSIN